MTIGGVFDRVLTASEQAPETTREGGQHWLAVQIVVGMEYASFTARSVHRGKLAGWIQNPDELGRGPQPIVNLRLDFAGCIAR